MNLLPERSALAPGARADCSAATPPPRRGGVPGAPDPERTKNCVSCRRPFSDPPRPGRPFVRCPDCRFDYSKGAKNGSRAGERHTPRFKYVPPTGPIVVDVVAPGQYGCTDVQDWRELSACFGMDANLFFGPDDKPERKDAEQFRVTRAKAICRGCAVRSDCLDYALRIGERHGIWGGKTARERRKLAVSRRPI